MSILSSLSVTWTGGTDPKSIASWLLIVIACVFSAVSVIACISDKIRSKKKGKSRIAEATLIAFAAFGGAAAMFLTMLVIRHKTKHPRFMIGLPLMILFQAAIAYLIYF